MCKRRGREGDSTKKKHYFARRSLWQTCIKLISMDQMLPFLSKQFRCIELSWPCWRLDYLLLICKWLKLRLAFKCVHMEWPCIAACEFCNEDSLFFPRQNPMKLFHRAKCNKVEWHWILFYAYWALDCIIC